MCVIRCAPVLSGRLSQPGLRRRSRTGQVRLTTPLAGKFSSPDSGPTMWYTRAGSSPASSAVSRQLPATEAPRARANWTAARPTPPGRPVDKGGLPGRNLRPSLVGGHAHGRQRGGSPVPKVHRFEHDRLLRGCHHFGECRSSASSRRCASSEPPPGSGREPHPDPGMLARTPRAPSPPGRAVAVVLKAPYEVYSWEISVA